MARGVDIFRVNHWAFALFPYPPMVPRLFGWVALVSAETAWKAWLAAVGMILVASGLVLARTRKGLGLDSPPWPAMAALAALSTPAVAAMERGQCDPLALPLLFASAWLLGRRTRPSEWAAGGLIGLAAWIKYYPGAAILVLVAGQRWRALAAALAVVLVVGAADFEGVRRAIQNGAIMAADPGTAALHPVQHAIGQFWPALWKGAPGPLSAVGGLPGPLASALLLGPPTLLIALGLARAGRERADRLALPAMLWLTAAATFAMPYSNDYNLIALPMAALAIARRDDPMPVVMALGLLLPYWQPLRLQIDGPALFVAKLLALQALAVSFHRLASNPARRPNSVPVPRPHLRAA